MYKLICKNFKIGAKTFNGVSRAALEKLLVDAFAHDVSKAMAGLAVVDDGGEFFFRHKGINTTVSLLG